MAGRQEPQMLAPVIQQFSEEQGRRLGQQTVKRLPACANFTEFCIDRNLRVIIIFFWRMVEDVISITVW